jgi:hypothetical protein
MFPQPAAAASHTLLSAHMSSPMQTVYYLDLKAKIVNKTNEGLGKKKQSQAGINK